MRPELRGCLFRLIGTVVLTVIPVIAVPLDRLEPSRGKQDQTGTQ